MSESRIEGVDGESVTGQQELPYDEEHDPLKQVTINDIEGYPEEREFRR